MSEAERIAETETAGIVAALDVLIESAATAYTYGDAPIGVTLVFKPIVRTRDRLVYLENENAAIRAQEQNEPLTCDGCEHEHCEWPDIENHCWACKRSHNYVDQYEPKHAPDSGKE